MPLSIVIPTYQGEVNRTLTHVVDEARWSKGIELEDGARAAVPEASRGEGVEIEGRQIGAGDIAREHDEALPFKPWAALDRLEETAVLRTYMGEKFLKAYAAVKRAELDDFLSEITPREYEWYL